MVEGMGTVLDAISGDAVETAEVCLFMEYDVGCVYTDGSGAFALPSLPSGALRATQIGKSGHAPVISWFTVPESGWSSTARLVPQDVTDVIVDDLGGGQDTSRGHIVVRAVDGSGAPVEGASLETVPPTQNDPAYLGDDGMPSPDLSATGPNGLIVIPNVVEGAIDVRVTDAGGNNCLPDVVSEIGDDPSMTRLRVLAGHWAAAPGFDFTCG